MVTTLVATNQGNGEIHLSVSQSAATATDVLVAAPAATHRVIVTEVCLGISVDGTITFLGADSDAALSGAIPVTAASGFATKGSARRPAFVTAKGTAFKITSVTGAAKGYIKYRIGTS